MGLKWFLECVGSPLDGECCASIKCQLCTLSAIVDGEMERTSSAMAVQGHVYVLCTKGGESRVGYRWVMAAV